MYLGRNVPCWLLWKCDERVYSAWPLKIVDFDEDDHFSGGGGVGVLLQESQKHSMGTLSNGGQACNNIFPVRWWFFPARSGHLWDVNPKLSKLFHGGGWKKTKDITKGHDLRQSVCLNVCVFERELWLRTRPSWRCCGSDMALLICRGSSRGLDHG